MNRKTALAFVTGLVAALPASRGAERTVQLRYQRPAQYELAAGIRKVGIAQFGGQTDLDKRWGDIAADRLAAAMDEYNRKYNRYELVDRKRLKAVLDEQDLQLAISDSASAGKVGKLAKVDAMIYGTVSAVTRDETATRTTFDPLRRGMKTVSYTKRYCMATVNFTMDEVATGKTLAAVSTKREYDSEADKKSGVAGIGQALGFGGDKLPPAEQVISKLIDECVAEFLGKISPHEVSVVEKLQKGKSKACDTGNKLATAGEYAEALECYQRAMQERPEDHGAVFNAGLMHEAQGHLTQAAELYDKAFKMEPEEQYLLARKRVRQEGGE